jgi:hypothetical protein
MPEYVDIDDLLDPQLTDYQRQAIAAMEAHPVEISVETVLEGARERTGLSDFGPDDFRERLKFLIDEWNDDRTMLQINRAILLAMAQRYAATRLLARDLLKRHPEINEEVIDRPIFVAGMPRSGTTHLLNLLAADSRLRSLPLWISSEPLPNPQEPARADGVDPRYARCAETWEQMQRASPRSASMHPMDPDHFHEDLDLMCPDFASYHFEWMSRVPRWRDRHCATDQTPHYQYQKTLLKALQWGKGPTRWVNKCPQHLEQLAVMRRVYPDAIMVITYRDPVDVIQSAATMMGHAERMRYPRIDAPGLLEYWSDRADRMLRACVRDRGVWPDAQRVDVPFADFMRDEMKVVHEVQAKAGLAVTAESDAEIRHFVETHPRGKFGQVRYNLERDFGISRAEARKRFDYYFEAFPFVKAED